MLFAIAFKLDQSKILSFSKKLMTLAMNAVENMVGKKKMHFLPFPAMFSTPSENLRLFGLILIMVHLNYVTLYSDGL